MTPSLFNNRLRALAIILVFCESIASANDVTMGPDWGRKARSIVAGAFASMPACDALEFTSDGALRQLGRDDVQVTADWLGVVIENTKNFVPRPFEKKTTAALGRELNPEFERRFPYWPKSDRFHFVLQLLKGRLEGFQGEPITLAELLLEAEARLKRAKASGEIGECYKVSQVTGTWNTEWVQVEALSVSQQIEIDQLFARKLDASRSRFSQNEAQALADRRLTLDEIAELRAIRAATRLFEAHTVLSQDLGGYIGNMAFAGAVRTVCRTEAQTYYFFLRRLQARRLLRYFRPLETWAFRPTKNPFDGHAGSLLENRRSKSLFVVDSWHEDGGTAAHLTSVEDWLQENDYADVVTAD